MKREVTGGISEAVRSVELWVAVAMFLVVIPLQYPHELIPFVHIEDPESVLGLQRHAIERMFVLLPITYVGFLFGMRAGLAASGLALVIMLPRALFISDYRSDALVEVGGVVVAGAVINIGFERLRAERERREEVLRRLQGAQEQLRTQFEVIRTSERQLAAVNDISSIVSQSLELGDILNLAADKVMEVANVDAVLISLVDGEGRELVLETYRGISELTAASVKRMKVGEGLDGRVAQTGEPLVVEDASHDPRLTKPMIAQEKIQAQFIAPLKSKGKVLGTLCVATRNARQFAPEEIDLLCASGRVIGIAVENARLYQKEREIAAWLQQSEQSYRSLLEDATEAILFHDLKGKIIAANRACLELTGYSREELIGMNVKDFLSSEGLNQAREVGRKLLQGEALDGPYEQELLKEDGSEVRLRLSATLITRDGRPKAFQLTARDITEERLAQRKR